MYVMINDNDYVKVLAYKFRYKGYLEKGCLIKLPQFESKHVDN